MVIDANGWIIRLTFLFGGVVDWALGLCNYCGLAVNFWCGGGLDASIEAIAPWRITGINPYWLSLCGIARGHLWEDTMHGALMLLNCFSSSLLLCSHDP